MQAPSRPGRRTPRLSTIDGEELRRRREAAGLTQALLAAEAGVAAVTIWRMETGGGPVRLATVAKLAVALDRIEASPTLRALLGQQ